MKKIFLEERIKNFKNKGNGSVVSQYNLLEKSLIKGTNETFNIFWRVDTIGEGTYLRLNYYYVFKNREENKSLNYMEISKTQYEIVCKKVYDIIGKHRNELPKVREVKKCSYKKQNEIPILHINLKKYIEDGEKEMNKLINEVKKLHNYLKDENF